MGTNYKSSQKNVQLALHDYSCVPLDNEDFDLDAKPAAVMALIFIEDYLTQFIAGMDRTHPNNSKNKKY